MVRTTNLVKHFRDGKGKTVPAVENVSMEAHPGQIVGLLGVNGAGKTTLLRMLSTMIRPTSGEAFVYGASVLKEPEKVRASIGFMSTSTALYGRLSAKESLEYFGGLYGLAGQALERRIEAVINRLTIGPFADRLCDKLSTGQKQRVSIARTILHDPPVLFFDEPTAGLDVVTSQIVMEFIESVRDLGKTVIYCTHIMSEVERLCDHVYVIHDGKVMGNGSVQDLKNQTDCTSLERAFLKLVSFQPELGSGEPE